MAFIVKERLSNAVIAYAADHSAMRAFEGNWYFQPQAVNMAHLKVTERTYTCPYKGVCFWIDLVNADGLVAQNIGWVYRDPKPTYDFIKDQIGFYNRPTSGTITETTAETVPAP